MRNTKMEAIALEEALWLDDTDLVSPTDIRPRLDEVEDDAEPEEIGLRRLYERPEILKASLQYRLRL